LGGDPAGGEVRLGAGHVRATEVDPDTRVTALPGAHDRVAGRGAGVESFTGAVADGRGHGGRGSPGSQGAGGRGLGALLGRCGESAFATPAPVATRVIAAAVVSSLRAGWSLTK